MVDVEIIGYEPLVDGVKKLTHTMLYRQIQDNLKEIEELSKLATGIVREHFDPIIGKAQNDYMIEKFQSAEAIREQIKHGYLYYMVKHEGRNVGFLAVCSRTDSLYLSKFYLLKEERGKGYARDMLSFVVSLAGRMGFTAITLNVNRNNDAIYAYEKMGFVKIREEKNDIGQGFFMDDYVYEYQCE